MLLEMICMFRDREQIQGNYDTQESRTKVPWREYYLTAGLAQWIYPGPSHGMLFIIKTCFKMLITAGSAGWWSTVRKWKWFVSKKNRKERKYDKFLRDKACISYFELLLFFGWDDMTWPTTNHSPIIILYCLYSMTNYKWLRMLFVSKTSTSVV